jgi:hypothetical protein
MSEAQAIEADVQALQDEYESGGDTSPLIERLNARIAEFLARGDTIEWIEAEHDALVRLFLEGGEEVVSLDPDPEVDLGWYGEFEVRACPREGLWVYRKGRFGHISGHIVT